MKLQSVLVKAIRYGVSLGIASTVVSLSSSLPASATPAVLRTNYAESWVNVRNSPSTEASVRLYARGGDRVETLQEIQGEDGYTWYRVRFTNSGNTGWVREDLLSLNAADEVVVAQGQESPSQSSRSSRSRTQTEPTLRNGANGASSRTQTEPTLRNGANGASSRTQTEPTLRNGANGASSRTQTEPTVRNGSSTRNQPVARNSTPTTVPTRTNYTQEQIDYFMEIALNSEYGSIGGAVKKWDGPVRIKVNGSPTQADMTTLRSVIDELNQLTNGAITLQLTNSNPNAEIYFVPESQFSRYEPSYQPVNMGFFWVSWDGNTLNRSRILITTEGVTQQERSHLIREELTQSLGLMQDSERYRDSIFYQGWTSVTSYTALDRAVISLLYRPEIRAGMTQNQIVSALRTINSTQRASAN